MNLANACANVPHLQTSSSRATEFERQILNWRIRRLVNSGLLRKQVISYLAAEALYSITRGGIQALEELGVTHLGGYVEREKDPHAAQISRVLELNRIRLALERSGTLALWVPETFIRVVNLSPTFCYAKVYDAVATVDLGNKVWAEFAIEDERTLKTEQKYAKILEGFATERRVQTILYLTQSYEIVATLRWYFRHARLEILLGLVNEFKEDVLDCQVDRAVDYSRMTLREALSRAASQSKSSGFGLTGSRMRSPAILAFDFPTHCCFVFAATVRPKRPTTCVPTVRW